MKPDRNDLDLRRAFAPMPEDCRRALTAAARSVGEEPPVKRAPRRAVLIAALILIATMAVAFAASRLGWADYFGKYAGIALPKAAEEILNATEPKRYQVGPMTFTFTQLLADGRIALSAAEIRTTDGTEALYTPWEPYEAVGALGDTVCDRYGLKPETTWVEAARQLALPLYCVRALIEVEPSLAGGDAMEDVLWNDDGAIVCLSMPATDAEKVKGVLPVTLYMAVMEFDPYTGEEKEKWTVREAAEIPVSGMLAQKTYAPEAGAELNGMALSGARAEQFATGVYVYVSLLAPDGMDEEAAIMAAYGLTLLDGAGEELPGGVNLSTNARVDGWPTVVLECMVSLDELPDGLRITDGTAVASLR